MDSPIYSWPGAALFWPLLAWAVLRELGQVRRAARTVGPQDAGSLRLIALGMRLGLPAALLLPWIVPGPHPPGSWTSPAFLLGLLLMLGGGLLRRHCFRALGEHFQFAVTVRPGQPVVERGAYRWVRHPSYTAGALLALGIGLAIGHPASLALLMIASAIGYAYRVRVEERALLETIGDPYRDYMRRTRRFVPFLF